jgi:hypothetical protein
MLMSKKIKVAFIKFGGLAAGGTERWLQMMAANLNRDLFEVDYYYCDAAPYVGSDYRHAGTDPDRLRYMQGHGVNLIEFRVGAKDVTTPTHDWLDTDFWEVFDPAKYDLVQAAKVQPEYPFYLLDLPVVECISLVPVPDNNPNIAWSIHLSQWQRARWLQRGGQLDKSSVIPIPVMPPAATDNLRQELGIPDSALVAGFHQRASEHIFSPIPLRAFARLQRPDRHFVIMGGSRPHREQARRSGLKNVHFIDHNGDAVAISKFLNTLDIFAHGRHDGETFGVVLAEAMIHGLPCLSHFSRTGANAQPETMGPAGLFATDLADYTAKLELLFTNVNLRSKLAAKARPHAEKYYSLESCVAELEQIYGRVVGLPVGDASGDKISYGYSAGMGFLWAGEMKRSNLAYNVLTGGIAEGFEVHITRLFLSKAQIFIDIGADVGPYCLVAAHEGPPGVQVYAF